MIQPSEMYFTTNPLMSVLHISLPTVNIEQYYKLVILCPIFQITIRKPP
jgi:hypothetical protein